MEDNTSEEDKIEARTDALQRHSITEQIAQQIAQNALKATVYFGIQKPDGVISQGSGFFIRSNYIATNYHVIEGATAAYIKLVGKQTTYRVGNITAIDPEHDLAILKVSNANPVVLSLANSGKVEIGETVSP